MSTIPEVKSLWPCIVAVQPSLGFLATVAQIEERALS